MSVPLFDRLESVGARFRESAHILLCCDFDGGLAPVFDHDAMAEVSAEVRGPLLDLAATERLTIAIVSGRSAIDLRGRADIPGLIVMGNHGLEIAGPDWTYIDPAVAESAAAVEPLAAALIRKFSSFPGADVERKELSISVHYQQAATELHLAIRSAVHEVLGASSHPFVLSEGVLSFDIRPRVYWHKGEAVRWLCNRVGVADTLVVFIGGDPTDEDAFAALADGVTIRVGTGGETTANYHVDGPDAVRKFLEWMRDFIQPLAV